MSQSISKFRLFETHLLQLSEKQPLYRMLLGHLIVDFLPIGWFVVFFKIFSVILAKSYLLGIVSPTFASLSVFGFNRILHAIVMNDKSIPHFYTQDEWSQLDKAELTERYNIKWPKPQKKRKKDNNVRNT